jgi:hypothetical protein
MIASTFFVKANVNGAPSGNEQLLIPIFISSNISFSVLLSRAYPVMINDVPRPARDPVNPPD